MSKIIEHPIKSPNKSNYYPDLIKVGTVSFQKKNKPSDINWVIDKNDYIEFSRDRDFLSWRFGSYLISLQFILVMMNQELQAYFIIRMLSGKVVLLYYL